MKGGFHQSAQLKTRQSQEPTGLEDNDEFFTCRPNRVYIDEINYTQSPQFTRPIHVSEVGPGSREIYADVTETALVRPHTGGFFQLGESEFVWLIEYGAGFLEAGYGSVGYLGGNFQQIVAQALYGLVSHNANAVAFSIRDHNSRVVMWLAIMTNPV